MSPSLTRYSSDRFAADFEQKLCHRHSPGMYADRLAADLFSSRYPRRTIMSPPLTRWPSDSYADRLAAALSSRH